MVFLSRILEKALADSGQNPVAHFLAGELLDFFSCILQCFHDGDEMEHAEPLPLFSDLLKEEYLWSEEYDEEEDEMRYEEDEVFPDDLFYSFYYYSWQAVKATRMYWSKSRQSFPSPLRGAGTAVDYSMRLHWFEDMDEDENRPMTWRNPTSSACPSPMIPICGKWCRLIDLPPAAVTAGAISAAGWPISRFPTLFAPL